MPPARAGFGRKAYRAELSGKAAWSCARMKAGKRGAEGEVEEMGNEKDARLLRLWRK